MIYHFEKVLAGKALWSVEQADVLTWFKSLPSNSVHFFFSSPPYSSKALRYNGEKSSPDSSLEWIDWMCQISVEAVRVCVGDVLWVVNGFVKNNEYHPVVEGLVWKLYQSGIVLDRPCIWTKNAPPNRKNWYSNCWEYVLCLKKSGGRPFWNWQSVAEKPKYKSGGHFRQRDSKGVRKIGNAYPKLSLARPKDVIRATVGGGHMGSPLAHLNEAPFPESLVEHFLPALCPPGGIVCDPFAGSGSTGAVALKHGRRFVGCDIRESQVTLANERLCGVKYEEGQHEEKILRVGA